jgi:hypothetical protein
MLLTAVPPGEMLASSTPKGIDRNQSVARELCSDRDLFADGARRSQ